MSKDDIETFEARIEDKILFQNVGLIALSGSMPLGIEKLIDYFGSNSTPTDLAIVVTCVIFAFGGAVFVHLASKRQKKVETFKERLFKEERKLSSSFSMIDTSTGIPSNIRQML